MFSHILLSTYESLITLMTNSDCKILFQFAGRYAGRKYNKNDRYLENIEIYPFHIILF